MGHTIREVESSRSTMKSAILLAFFVACATSYVVQPSKLVVGHKNKLSELEKLKVKRSVQNLVDDVCQKPSDQDVFDNFCMQVAFAKLRKNVGLDNSDYEDKCNSCRDDVCIHLYCTDLECGIECCFRSHIFRHY